MNNPISIIVIAGNEANMISDCLKSCLFASEIILITTPVTNDNTSSIAKGIVPNIKIKHISQSPIDFSLWRNSGATLATGKWLLFVDADERITPELQAEVQSATMSTTFSSFDIPRANYFLGHRVKHGNTYPDYVKRLFLKSKFKGYKGQLHEQPTVTGKSSKLNSDFLHYTHRDLTSMLDKSLKWTAIESQLIYNTNHPLVVWWRIVRMMATKLFERLITQSMWRDGTVGWISAIFETFDTYLIYSQLWETQQNTALQNKVL